VNLPRVAGCLNRAPARRGRVMSLFLGPRGVRAGWRVALYVALCALWLFAVLFALRALATPLHLTAPKLVQGGLLVTPYFAMINEITVGVPFVLASLVMAWLEGGSPLDFGLRGTRPARRFGFGVAAGLVGLGALVAILLAGHWGIIALASGGLRPGLEWALVCLAIGFVEEYGFRGYPLQALGRGIGFWPAALATSLLFGIAHGTNPGETPVGLVTAAMLAFVFCVSRACTGALWWAIGCHAAWDYAENFLAGTHDSGTVSAGAMASFLPLGNRWLSGGATGPEGSVFCIAIVAAMGLGAWRGLRPLPG
jgi:membrane protease YdiL (CAAX protease family)